MGILAEHGGTCFADRAADLPSCAVRQQQREAAGLGALNGSGAADFTYEHRIVAGRPVLVRGARRANRPERDDLRRTAALPPRCLHVVSGSSSASCAYCQWIGQPDRVPVKRDSWRPMAADLADTEAAADVAPIAA